MRAYKIIRSFLSELKKDNVGAHASSAAFFIFLSLIPFIILMCSILPFTPIREADLMRAVTDILPMSMDSFAVNLINEIYGKSVALVSVTAIITIWSAAKGILAMMRAMNAVNEVEETRNYFMLRLRASIYTLIILVMIILSLIFMVFGNVIMEMIHTYIPHLYMLLSIIMNLRYIIVWIVLTIFTVLLYVWLPNKRPKFKSQIFGACFTSIGWIVFSFVFSLYIDTFGGLGMYGSLTTIIIIMIWLYICMYIMILGAEFNSMFDETLAHFPVIRNLRNRNK